MAVWAHINISSKMSKAQAVLPWWHWWRSRQMVNLILEDPAANMLCKCCPILFSFSLNELLCIATCAQSSRLNASLCDDVPEVHLVHTAQIEQARYTKAARWFSSSACGYAEEIPWARALKRLSKAKKDREDAECHCRHETPKARKLKPQQNVPKG